MKFIKFLGFLVIGVTSIYLLGPAPANPVYTGELIRVPTHPMELEKYITTNEKKYEPIKPGNEAKIIWYNDSTKKKTPFSLIYLHGFSASHEEGNPIHTQIAKEYGMNLFLSR